MAIISYDEISLTHKGAIHEFVVISILFYQAKTEIGIFPHDVA